MMLDKTDYDEVNSIKKGSIVFSKSGHDKQSFYVAVEVKDGFAYIADGRRRKIANPKKKSTKHLSPTKIVVDTENLKTDKKVRRVLWEYNFGEAIIPNDSVAE